MIEPNIHAYGTYARDSALADFLELQALYNRRSMTRADLGDYVIDNNWTRLSQEHVVGPAYQPAALQFGMVDLEEELPGDEQDAGLEVAGRVFDLLSEREDALADIYPFTVQDTHLTSVAASKTSYVSLLAIIVAHAWRIETAVNPRHLFEELVVRALQNVGLLAQNFAENRRGGGDFSEAIRCMGEHLNLCPTPEMAYRATHARDAGVDTIGHLWWGDLRPGNWIFIGQATCCQSDDWEKKMLEPRPNQWKRLLGGSNSPVAFLAVPHHVPESQLSLLVQNTGRCVLDRLRLSRHLEEPQAREQAVIDAVLSQGLQTA